MHLPMHHRVSGGQLEAYLEDEDSLCWPRNASSLAVNQLPVMKHVVLLTIHVSENSQNIHFRKHQSAPIQP